MADIDGTLAERGKTPGNFTDNSRIAQQLKAVMYSGPNWPVLKDHQKEAHCT